MNVTEKLENAFPGVKLNSGTDFDDAYDVAISLSKVFKTPLHLDECIALALILNTDICVFEDELEFHSLDPTKPEMLIGINRACLIASCLSEDPKVTEDLVFEGLVKMGHSGTNYEPILNNLRNKIQSKKSVHTIDVNNLTGKKRS